MFGLHADDVRSAGEVHVVLHPLARQIATRHHPNLIFGRWSGVDHRTLDAHKADRRCPTVHEQGEAASCGDQGGLARVPHRLLVGTTNTELPTIHGRKATRTHRHQPANAIGCDLDATDRPHDGRTGRVPAGAGLVC